MKIVEVPIKFKKSGKSHHNFKNMVDVDLFFDWWVLKWVLSKECNLALYRRILSVFACIAGMALFTPMKLLSSFSS